MMEIRIDPLRINSFMVMNEDELLDELLNLLSQHRSIDGCAPIRGNPGQEPYRSDIFIIFKALHKRKRKPRYFNEVLKQLKNEPVCEPEILHKITTMWDEWCYCWKYMR